MRTQRVISFILTSCILLFLAAGTTYSAYDQPHTPDNTIQCGNCHFTSGSSTPAWMTAGSGDNTVNNLRCTQCHTHTQFGSGCDE